MNIETMYREAMAEIAHKPDPAKGKTAKEWAADFAKWEGQAIGEQAARGRIRKLCRAGKMLCDMDWRPFEGAMRRTAVYRFVKEKGGKRE